MCRYLKRLMVVVTIVAVLLTLASCGGKKQGTDNPLLQGIYDNLIANTDYADWKNMFYQTKFEEKLYENSIVISAKGDVSVKGDYIFALDGDFLVNTTDAENYTSYSMMQYFREAVADYYGMNIMLMNGYLSGLSHEESGNPYYIVEEQGDKTVLRLYVAGEWDLTGIDEMYVTEESLEYYDALDEEFIACYADSGKITVAADGNVKHLVIFIGEYGENTELTYRSLMAIVNKLKPNGYASFIETYSGLNEIAEDGYSVRFDISEELAENLSYVPAEGYSYITVEFGEAEAVG